MTYLSSPLEKSSLGIRKWEMSQIFIYRCADKSLARPVRKQATATKILTFASHSKTIQKFIRPTGYWRQQRPPRRTNNGELSIAFFFSRVGLRIYQHPCIYRTAFCKHSVVGISADFFSMYQSIQIVTARRFTSRQKVEPKFT